MGESKWGDEISPNSESTLISPGISFMISSKAGSFGINIQRPEIDNLSVNDGGVDQRSEQWQFSISYRKNLDKMYARSNSESLKV